MGGTEPVWRILNLHPSDSGFPRNLEASHLMLKGDNKEIMSLLKHRFEGQIRIAYVDPPYNTGTDAGAFSYANRVGDDAWVFFMRERLDVLLPLLSEEGCVILTIDDHMMAHLKILCDEIFGRSNFVGCIPVRIKPGGRSNDSFIAVEHEYILMYAKKIDSVTINLWPESEKNLVAYKEQDDRGKYKFRDFMRTGGHATPTVRPNSLYPIKYHRETHEFTVGPSLKEFIDSESIAEVTEQVIADYVQVIQDELSDDDSNIIFPVDTSDAYRVWRQTKASFLKLVEDNQIAVAQTKKYGAPCIRIKDYAKDGVLPPSMWTDKKYDASTHGTKLLEDLIGKNEFSYPKSLHAVRDVVELFTSGEKNDIVLDMFGGSGTTTHAVMDLNSDDQGSRRCISIEIEDYIDTVAYRRACEVASSVEKMVTYSGNSLLVWSNPESTLEGHTVDEKTIQPLILAEIRHTSEEESEHSVAFGKWMNG